MIGHNSDNAAFAAHSMSVEDLFKLTSDTLEGGPVATDEQESALDGLLDEFRKARKAADDQRAAEKKPHTDAGNAVQALWKPLIDRAIAGETEIKRALTPYRNAKQKAKDDAAEIARQEAARQLEEACKAIQASDNLEDRFDAEEALKQARKASTKANKIDRSAKGTRTHWTAHVDDRRAALNWLLPKFPERFAALIQQLADEACRSGRPQIDGVRYTSQEIAT